MKNNWNKLPGKKFPIRFPAKNETAPDLECSCGELIYRHQRDEHEDLGHFLITKEDDEKLLNFEREAYDNGEI